MMFPSLVLPLAAAVLVALLLTTMHRRLTPLVATWVVTVTLAVVTAAALPTLWILSLGYVTHLPVIGPRLQWCAAALGVHAEVPSWLGVPAVLLTITGIVRVRSVLGRYREVRRHHPGAIEIAEHEQPFAYTLPGRGGHIVLSSGLVEILNEAEQGVVLAHESAHARNRHDRYLLIAQFSAALVPFVRPLAARVQYSLERFADEVAVAHCGDRDFVARTLGKVALHGAPPAMLSFAGLGVPARVAALLSPPTAPLRTSANVALWGAIVMTTALAVYQIHHLALLVAALCHT